MFHNKKKKKKIILAKFETVFVLLGFEILTFKWPTLYNTACLVSKSHIKLFISSIQIKNFCYGTNLLNKNFKENFYFIGKKNEDKKKEKEFLICFNFSLKFCFL